MNQNSTKVPSSDIYEYIQKLTRFNGPITGSL